jgi:PAS domain S-box-containing protein
MTADAKRGWKALRVLFVEDLPTDAELAERALRRGDFEIESRRVDAEEAFIAALREFVPDIVISDYSMPAFDGMTALRLARTRDPSLPFIILTGSMNEDTAVECMKAGASDYVIKEHMMRLPFAVKEAIERQKNMILSEEAARRLRESEERYRALFEDSHAVMLILDPEDATVVEANQAACDFYGWRREAPLGMKMTDFILIGEDELKRNIARAIGRKSHRFTLRHRKADGTIVDVEVYAGPVLLGGKTQLFSIIHDVSAKVAAERERDEFASRLDHYLSTSPTVTYSLRVKDGKAQWQWVSENVKALLGFSLEEALEPEWWLRNVHASDRMRALSGISRLASKGAFGQEYRFHRKDRELVWLRDEMRLVQTERGETEIVGTLTDITARKKVESDLSLKSLALEAAANAIVITDREGTIQWVNPAFRNLTGYSRDEAIGLNPRVLKSDAQDPDFYRSLWDTILSGKVWQGEIVNKRKGGELYTEEMTITPVLDDSRIVRGFIAIKSDVTDRKLSRERLEASLAEKEILLREIHHRINNNMQLITSLLSLSSRRISDTSLRDLLEGISRRIVSMALVHEQFYDSPDMARIDFVIYLHQLADGIGGDLGRSSGKVSIVAEQDAVLLSLEQAIPAGLAADELMTNAMKHAYPAGSPPGEVRMSLRRVGDAIELSVRDRGIGLPAAFVADKAESLGMILIHILAEQLRGRIDFRSHGGTEAILRFPAI